MGGFFGTITKSDCVTDLFYGTDYNSHLGTKRAGLATYNKDLGFRRTIHNIENSYFRTKFEDNLPKLSGESGIGTGCELHQIEILKDDAGKPVLYFEGVLVNGFVSITHTKTTAAAQVILMS